MGAAAGALEPLKKLGASFGSSTAAQKVIAVVGVLALVMGGTLFWRWASEPSMTPLFSNLAMADASAITEQLDATGTRYELVDGGATILVPQDEVYGLRLDMSAAGLPGDAGTGYALLDEQGVTASQFQQRTTWQRALEGELSTTIGAISSVESARVQLAIPEDDVFADTAGTPTASVLVTTRPGQVLAGGQVQSVLNLVSSSVEGMKPEDVTVVDAAGNLLSAAGAAGGGAAGGVRDQQTTDYESRITGDLQQVLDQVVGPGKAVATVTADLDFDDVVSTEETFTNPEGGPLALAESGSEEEYTGAGGALVGGQLGGTGILGPDNIAVPVGGAEGTDGAAGGYTNTSTDRTNGVNKLTRQTQSAPGGVRRQSVSVVVDTEASRAVDMAALQEAVGAAAGIDPARGDVISVSQMPFDTTGADAAAEAAAAGAAAEAAEERAALIQTAAVLGTVLLLLIVAVIAALRRRKKQQEPEPLDLGPMEPLPAPPPTEALAAVPAPRVAIEQAPKQPAAVAREQVVELAESSPDDVAELLRGWLTADKR